MEQGSLIDALTCFEKAVDLDPYGHLDKLKLNFLKKKFEVPTVKSVQKLNYKRHVLAGASLVTVVALLSGIGHRSKYHRQV